MDQQDFRKFISSSSSAHPSSSSSSSTSRLFGAQLKRSAAPSASTSTAKDLFAPRKKIRQDQNGSHHPDNPRPSAKNSATGQVYIDRAKARRVGKEDEDYSDVNRLAEEWQAKLSQAQNEEERREIEQQMAFLGGDSRHSILVKGLDHSLLAQQKAKEVGADGDVDQVLEQAYDAVASTRTDSSSVKDEEMRPSLMNEVAGEKRSREAVIEALKRRKLAKDGTWSRQDDLAKAEAQHRRQGMIDAEFERAKRLGKFKPIKATAAADAVVADDKGEVIVTKEGKRLRRKKKKTLPKEGKEEQDRQISETASVGLTSLRQASTARTSGQSPDVIHSSPAESMMPTVRSDTSPLLPESLVLSTTEVASAPPVLMSVSPTDTSMADIQPEKAELNVIGEEKNEDDDDDDIFADAGRWEGLPSDDSDSDESETEKSAKAASSLPPPPEPASSPLVEIAPSDPSVEGGAAAVSARKRNWFGEDTSETSTKTDPTLAPRLPVHLDHHLSSGHSSSSAPHNSLVPPTPQVLRQSKEQGEGKEEEDDNEVVEATTTTSSAGRLQGLSTSSLPSNVSRMLLRAEEEEEQRLREKEKGWWKKKKEDRKRRKGGEGGEEGEEVDEEERGRRGPL